MQGDNLAVLLFAWSLAVAFFLEGRRERHWRQWLFWGLAAGFFVAGPAWPNIENIWPQGEEFGRRVATDPTAWFVLFMGAMVLVALSGKHIKPARLLNDESTKSLAGTVRWLAEFSSGSGFEWPPKRGSTEFYRFESLFDSTSPIFTNPEINDLRRQFRVAIIAMGKARKTSDTKEIDLGKTKLSELADRLSHRLVYG